MLKKQAPGETILKVGGMLLLFLGVLLAFGSGNNLSLVMKGSSDSAVVEYLNQNGMTYSQLVASNVMVLVAGVIYLAAGVVGVKQAGKVENAGLCVGMGGLLIAEVVAEVIVTMIFGDFDPASVIRMLMFPAIYMIGAVLNWRGRKPGDREAPSCWKKLESSDRVFKIVPIVQKIPIKKYFKKISKRC